MGILGRVSQKEDSYMDEIIDPNEIIELARVVSGVGHGDNNEIAEQQRKLLEDIVRKNKIK